MGDSMSEELLALIILAMPFVITGILYFGMVVWDNRKSRQETTTGLKHQVAGPSNATVYKLGEE